MSVLLRAWRGLFIEQSVTGAMPWLVMSRVLGVALGFASSVLIARALGPYGKGVVGAVVLVSTVVVALGNLGVGQGGFFHLSRGDYSASVSFSVLTVVGVVAGAVCGILALPLVRNVLGITSGTLPGQFLLAGAVLGGLNNLGTFYSDVLRGLGLAHLASLIPVAAQGCFVATIVALLLAGWGVTGVTLAYVGAAIITIALTLSSFRRIGVLRFVRAPGAFSRFFRFGRPVYANGLVILFLTRFNQALILSRLGASQLGQFGVAVALAEMLWLIDLPLIGAAQFHVASRSREAAIELVNRMTRLISALLFAAALVVGVLARWLVPIVFGKAFGPAVGPLVLLLPGVLAWSVGRSVSQFIGFHLGRNDINLYANVFGSVVSVTASLLVVSRWGIQGVALATSLAYGVAATFLLVYYLRNTGVGPCDVMIVRKEDFRAVVMPQWRALQGVLRRRSDVA